MQKCASHSHTSAALKMIISTLGSSVRVRLAHVLDMARDYPDSGWDELAIDLARQVESESGQEVKSSYDPQFTVEGSVNRSNPGDSV